MDPIKQDLATWLKKEVESFVEKGLPSTQPTGEIEYLDGGNLSAIIRVKSKSAYGPRYFAFSVKETY
jgi:hypothetical protein